MQIDLAPASLDDAARLTNLFQFYVYDLSDIVGADCDADGRFALPSFDAYWSDAWRHPHLVRVDGKLAGFALVQGRSRITGDENTWTWPNSSSRASTSGAAWARPSPSACSTLTAARGKCASLPAISARLRFGAA